MESLPKGLVTTSGRISSHLADPNAVDAGDIARLWKVYHTNPAIHSHDSGHRLGNFFWRVWGNERLRSSSQGSTLAKLFVNIAESQEQSKLQSETVSSSGLKLEKMPSPVISPDTSTHVITAQLPPTPPTEENEPNLNSTRTHNSRSNSDPIPNTDTRSPLPPILKKPKSVNGNESSQKKARLLLTGLGGQHVTRKPSNPLTPISPPPFAAVSKEDAGTDTTPTTTSTPNPTAATATTTRGQYQTQKRPYFVANKTGKRRPVLATRKSSQTAVPRYEARGDYFAQGNTNTNTNKNLKTTGSGRDIASKEHDKPITPVYQEELKDFEKAAQQEPSDSEAPIPGQERQESKQDNHTESPNGPQPPDGKHINLDDPDLKLLPPNLVSNLKLLLAQKPTTTTKSNNPNNPKPRPKQTTFPSTTNTTTPHGLNDRGRNHLRRLKSTTYMHMHLHHLQHHLQHQHQHQHQLQQPTKLVDDHFRVRFAEELQREEKFLNAVNSLPEEERSAVLEGHSGRSRTPRLPRTAWVEVPGGEAVVGDIKDEEGPSVHASDDNDDWAFTGDGEDAGGWTADDAQDYYADTQVDAVPFKFEGMSYASSWRAACRLQVPGQLTVMLRAEQYGYRGDAEVVDST